MCVLMGSKGVRVTENAPGYRMHLAVLRQQLELTCPYFANEAEAAQEPVDFSPLFCLAPIGFLDVKFIHIEAICTHSSSLG